MTILPLTYLGPTTWFGYLAEGGYVIDTQENWVKQTARNRCEILTSTGVAALTIPVHGGRVRTSDVRIDNSKRWRATHWKSIVSAYRNSPYFDHYEERFRAVYDEKAEFLAEFNRRLLGVVVEILGLPEPVFSAEYVEAGLLDVDLRGKKALRRSSTAAGSASSAGSSAGSAEGSFSGMPLYVQVFGGAFEADLSIIDLIFCEGRGVLNKLSLLS